MNREIDSYHKMITTHIVRRNMQCNVRSNVQCEAKCSAVQRAVRYKLPCVRFILKLELFGGTSKLRETSVKILRLDSLMQVKFGQTICVALLNEWMNE